jgi:hypothetical protein
VIIPTRFSTVICAPVYSVNDGLASQVLALYKIAELNSALQVALELLV